MDQGVKDLFPVVVVLFGTIWAAHAAHIQSSKYINDIRNNILIGRIDRVYITADHAEIMLKKDWIELFIGDIFTMFLFGFLLLCGGLSMWYGFDLKITEMKPSAEYFIPLGYIVAGVIYAARAILTYVTCFGAERAAMMAAIARRKRDASASASGADVHMQPFSYVVHLRNVGSLARSE